MSEYHAKRLVADIKRISQSAEICEENRAIIFKFLDFMRANGVSPATQRSILWALSVIDIFLNKPFHLATKDDIINIVSKIEDRDKCEVDKMDFDGRDADSDQCTLKLSCPLKNRYRS